MSLKYQANTTGAKGFFFLHTEKIVLGVAALLVIGFIFFGMQLETLPESTDPEAFARRATQADQHLQQSTWERVAPTRQQQLDHGARVEIARRSTPDSAYAIPLFEPPLFRGVIKRKDPEILPPKDVEVALVLGGLAQKPKAGYVDLLDQSPLAEMPEVKAPKRPAPPKPRRTRGGEGEGMSMEGGFGMEEGLDMGGPSMAANVPKYRTLSSYLRQKFLREYFRPNVTAKVALDGRTLVAVKAVIDFKKQKEAFERTFRDSDGYDSARDFPEPMYGEVQRAKYTPGTPIKDEDWVVVSSTNWENRQRSAIQIPTVEYADPAYLDPDISHPIPPLAMVRVRQLGLHSLIPQQEDRTKKPTTPGTEEPAAEPDDGGIESGPGGRPAVGGGRPGALGPGGGGMRGLPGMSGMGRGMGLEGSGEEGYGGPGYGGMTQTNRAKEVDYKLIRFYDWNDKSVPLKPGESYVYRVRVYYDDPNYIGERPNRAASSPYGGGFEGGMEGGFSGGGYPGSTRSTITEAMLESEVLARLQKNRAADEARLKKDPSATPTTWIISPWSEPSDPLLIPEGREEFFVGETEAKPLFGLQLASGDVFYVSPLGEPTSKIAAVVWDQKYAARIPAEFKVGLGTVLNKDADADVMHPLSMRIHRLAGYKFKTDITVLDIDGGEDVRKRGRTADDLRAPGLVLLLDKNGQMIVRKEIDDAEGFRDQLFIDEGEAAATSFTSGMGEGMEGGMSMEGGMGMEGMGMEGGGGRRR